MRAHSIFFKFTYGRKWASEWRENYKIHITKFVWCKMCDHIQIDPPVFWSAISLLFIYRYFFSRIACILTLLLSPLDYHRCMGQCLKFHANFIQTYIFISFYSVQLVFESSSLVLLLLFINSIEIQANNNNNRFQLFRELISSIRDTLIVFSHCSTFTFAYNWFCQDHLFFDCLHSNLSIWPPI